MTDFCALYFLLVCKEIQNIPAGGGVAFVQLRVSAAGACDRNKLFILYIKYFGEVAAGCLKLVAFVSGVSAFLADIRFSFHT